jgi:hypothetical protein
MDRGQMSLHRRLDTAVVTCSASVAMAIDAFVQADRVPAAVEYPPYFDDKVIGDWSCDPAECGRTCHGEYRDGRSLRSRWFPSGILGRVAQSIHGRFGADGAAIVWRQLCPDAAAACDRGARFAMRLLQPVLTDRHFDVIDSRTRHLNFEYVL